MKFNTAYSIFQLGDTALIIEFAPVIDEQINDQVLLLFRFLKNCSLPEVLDLVPAYNSLAMFYDPLVARAQTTAGQTAFEVMAAKIQNLLNKETDSELLAGRRINIPVCYRLPYATDLQSVAETTAISADDIVQLHISKIYRVYMIGFLPGFAYMGEIDERIEMPRKKTPENVQAGSVGITGRQTGIYPLSSPGGWQIIGRTPLSIFNAEAEDPVLLQPGDTVKFFPITEDEFENYKGWHT